MRTARFLKGGFGVVLSACAFSLAGCTHNYYYGNAVPACGPATIVPGTVSNGAVCEVPSQSGSDVVAQSPARSTIIGGGTAIAGPRPPRVVVSQPRSGSPFRWRPADPESSLASTRIEGALDDSTSTR
jgi:hypothetical protein